MKFDHYEVRLINTGDSYLFFQLIERNRARLEDFLAGIVARTGSLTATQVFVDELVQEHIKSSHFAYLIINVDTQEPIGFIDVKNIDWSVPKAALGYFIDEKFAGKGIAKNAVNVVIAYFFEELNFVKLFLRIAPGNTASRRLAEKCGFTIEALLKKDYKTTNGDIVDMLYYGRVK